MGPYNLVWATATATNGKDALTAVARDGVGNTTTAAAVTVTVDNSAPTITVTAPSNGATVTGIVAVTATAADNVGIVGVQFKLDGVNLGAEATTSPYSVTWNTGSVANGPHVLTAIARDGAGNSITAASGKVTGSHDPVAPTVTMKAPGGGAPGGGRRITEAGRDS